MSSSQREIRVVTPSEVIVADIDYYLFADLFSPLHELGEDVDELTLTGATGEIFDEEWKYVWMLIGWMSEYNDLHEDNTYLSSVMRTYLGLKITSEHDWMTRSSVSLKQIERIRYIVNLPVGWEICVYTTDSSSESLSHLVRVGSILYDESAEEVNLGEDTSVPLVKSLSSTIRAFKRQGEGYCNAEESRAWLIALSAALRNATLANAKEGRSAMILDYDRDLVIAIASVQGYEPTRYTTAVMTGLGWSMTCWGELIGTIDLSEASMDLYRGPFSQYYKKGLKGLPMDVDPIQLGLRYIVGEHKGEIQEEARITPASPSHANNDLGSVVRWLNETLTLAVSYYREGKGKTLWIDSGDMRVVALIMRDYIVGRYGLERIRACLITYSDKHVLGMGENQMIASLLKAIEEILAGEVMTPQYRLPSRYEVQRLSRL